MDAEKNMMQRLRYALKRTKDEARLAYKSLKSGKEQRDFARRFDKFGNFDFVDAFKREKESNESGLQFRVCHKFGHDMSVKG